MHTAHTAGISRSHSGVLLHQIVSRHHLGRLHEGALDGARVRPGFDHNAVLGRIGEVLELNFRLALYSLVCKNSVKST